MTLRRLLTEPFRASTWSRTAYALLALPLGVFWFSLLVSLFAVSASLILFVVGLPLLALTVWIARAGASAERLLAASLLGVEIPPPPPEATEGYRPLRRFLAPLASPAAWREVVYLLLLFPIGIVLFVAAVVLWSMALAWVTAPAWSLALSEDSRGDVFWGPLDPPLAWAGVVAAGVALLLVTPWILRGLLALHAALMRALLGPTRGELERAAARAAEQRDLAVSAASGERRQIERDLHDGAQARLVALAVDLDRARRRLEEGAPPEEAAGLVRDAHESAKEALADIRDLARGIHPAVLRDRGLDAALSALAARCVVPVTVAAELEDRPPEPVEAAAYFVVAEALANVARHSRAEHASVSVARDDGVLVVEVRDDGVGGAEEAGGSGLAGLRERVGALGGTLVVESPPGGPTAITAVLPCA
ncbi:MAG TPA: sensor domain-containing protein [Gaiellaceae bacterium]|nr:sensor domain-containing protein [Gaiellaceae bacterium]